MRAGEVTVSETNPGSVGEGGVHQERLTYSSYLLTYLQLRIPYPGQASK